MDEPTHRTYNEQVVDSKGNVLSVGDRIRCYGFDPEKDKYENYHGRITEISDIDGDVDDWGRSIMIPPYVYVTYLDGDQDHFITQQQDWGESPFLCEDIDKVEGGNDD